jgi:hypothetical protein
VISSCCSWAVVLPWSIFSSDIFRGAERFRSRYVFQRYRKIEEFHFGANLLISQITPDHAGLYQVKCKTKNWLVCRFCEFLGLWSFGGPRGKYRRRAATNLTNALAGTGETPEAHRPRILRIPGTMAIGPWH